MYNKQMQLYGIEILFFLIIYLNWGRILLEIHRYLMSCIINIKLTKLYTIILSIKK